MANIVELTDFIGTTQLQEDDFTAEKFDPIRNEWERFNIYCMLGATLGDLFLVDFDANTPTTLTPRFQAIYDAFQIDDGDCGIRKSRGIKAMTQYIVWFYFARDNNITISLSGNKSAEGENSNPSADGLNLARNYNKGVESYFNIQWYICNNTDGHDYPEYNGQPLDYVIGI